MPGWLTDFAPRVQHGLDFWKGLAGDTGMGTAPDESAAIVADAKRRKQFKDWKNPKPDVVWILESAA